MTDTDATLAELRAVAEAVKPDPFPASHKEVAYQRVMALQRFQETFDQPTVIALITALEAVRALHAGDYTCAHCCTLDEHNDVVGLILWPCPTVRAIDDALQGLRSTVQTGAGGQE